jgi:hypothetical protein
MSVKYRAWRVPDCLGILTGRDRFRCGRGRSMPRLYVKMEIDVELNTVED